MGYPNLGKVKTIVLPVPKSQMTRKEYFDAYGIDLASIIKEFKYTKSEGNIYLDLILNVDITKTLFLLSYEPTPTTTNNGLYPVHGINHNQGWYNSGEWESDPTLYLDVNSSDIRVIIGIPRANRLNATLDDLCISKTNIA